MKVTKIVKEYKVTFGGHKNKAFVYCDTMEKAEAKVEEVLMTGVFSQAKIETVYYSLFDFSDEGIHQ